MGYLDALYDAAIAGDADARAKLEMEADRLYRYDKTILHIESNKGNAERVRFILKEFANKNLLAKLTQHKYTALHKAIYKGHTEVAEVIIEAARRQLPETSFQAFLRQGDEENDTALHYAVMEESIAIVKLLVEADPTDTHTQNNEGYTPMYMAVEQEYNDIVEIISATCAAPSLDGPDGSTALRVNNLDQVKCTGGTLYKIMDRDALYAAAISGDAAAITKLKMEADILNDCDETILHIESKNGNTERVQFILREFANKNLLGKLNMKEETVLHLAIYGGRTEVAEVIIEAARRHFPETSFKAFLRQGDKDMNTALLAAVKRGNEAIVKLLVEADPTDRHIQNKQEDTPMYIAVRKGYENIVKIISTTCTAPSLDGPNGSTALLINNFDQGGPLYKIMDRDALYAAAIEGDAQAIAKLEMKADILHTNGDTILHSESRFGNTQHVLFILREFANKNLLAKLTICKHTALHLATCGNNTEVAEVLIKAARRCLPETSFQAFLRQGDEDMDSALHEAVINGNVAIVKLLVEADPTDRHIQNNEGKTPMYIAAEEGKNNIVKVICTTCTAPSLDGPDGSTALHAAVKNYNQGIDAVEVLIDAARRLPSSPTDNDNTDSNPVNSFQAFLRRVDEDLNTALHIAVMQGNLATAKLLAQADPSNPGIQNNKGETPFYIAVESGYSDIVKMIWTTSTAASFDLDSPDGSTALHAAVKNHNHDIEVVEVLIDAARCLLSCDSDSDDIDSNPVSSFQAFLRRGDKDLNSALHIAVMQCNLDTAKLLIEADPSYKGSQNKKGQTPFYIAVERGFVDILKMMCTSTTCSDIVSVEGPCRNTSLHAAIKNAHHGIEVVEVLIDAASHLPSSDTDSSDTDDNPVSSFQAFLRRGDEDLNSALHIAVMQGHLARAKLLAKADPSYKGTQNNKGQTPIYIAAERGHNNIVKVICTTCTAPLNFDGPGGSTALHAAVKNDNYGIEVVEVLIDAARRFLSSDSDSDDPDSDNVSSFQAFLRRVDEEGNTALHIVVMQGNLASAKLLVEADPSYEGTSKYKGKTPFYIAAERGYADIVKMMCTTCTAPDSLLRGPHRKSYTAMHAIIKNLDEAKNEVRDVMKMIIDRLKCWIVLKNADIDEYEIHRTITDELFFETDEYRQTILELAVEKNYMEVVELILNVGNPACKDGWVGDDFISLMPLIYKAKDKGYNNIVELLTKKYEAGAKLSELSVHLRNQASMITTIRTHHTESAYDLLDNYAENLVLFADKLGWTLLHHAAYNEFNSIITRIVEEQKRFGHRFVYEDMVSTPFHIAAEKGYTSTMILLMQLWPSSSSAYTLVDKNGQNILHLAALQSKKKMIQGILKDCPEEYKKKFVNQQDKDGHTPLHLLIGGGCFVVQLLTYKGLDTRVENNNRWTPTDMLYVEDQISDDQVKIKIALDHIQIDQKKDIFSSSVLSISKREKKDVLFNEQAKQMINEKHARMKESTHARANCFADAIAGDHISKAALEMEADALQEEGKTILHVESMRGDRERVRYIVREFEKKNLLVKLDRLNQTALHLAVYHRHTQVVEVLIDAARYLPSSSENYNTHITPFQAYIRQATGPMRNTALHFAVLNGNVEIVKLLLQADPNANHVRNYEGKTAIYIAAEKGYKDIVKEICTTCLALSLDGPGGTTTALHAAMVNIHQEEEENNAIRMMMDAAKRWSPEGLNFEALLRRTNELGSTTLKLAVDRNYVKVVGQILREDPAYQHGCCGSMNHAFMRLIYTAIDRKNEDILRLLRETYEAQISVDYKGVIDLIVAVRMRQRVTAKGLLKGNKQIVTFADEDGWSVLHHAAYNQFDAILDVIIEAQIEVGHQFVYKNKDVSTPFHVAAKEGYTFTVIRLMELWPALRIYRC